jgi:hypothetical protein
MGIWQAFFAWPSGGIWSNMIADVIWFALGLAAAIPLRHHIGRRLVRFFHRHYSALLTELED